MVIYKLTNKVNGKSYVGQTTRDLKTRIAEHSRKHRTVIEKAIKKYGIGSFSIETIDSADTISELNKKEVYWIEQVGCVVPDGYNQCNGGDNTMGFNHREESKEKMSASHKELDKTAEKNPFFGKNHTEEQRRKWSEDRKNDPRYQENMRKARIASVKSTQVKVVNLDTKEVFDSIRQAADQYKLKSTHISRVCRGGRKTTGGFRWMYHDEYKKIPCQE